MKEYIYSGQEIPQNIKEYFGASPQEYDALYDSKFLEVAEIEESPLGSVKDVKQDASFLDPNGLPVISIAEFFDFVKIDVGNCVSKKANKLL